MTQLRPEQNEGRKSRATKQHLVLSSLFSTSSCTGEMREEDDEVELSPVFFSSRTNSSDREIYFILDCVLRGEQQQRCIEKMIALNGESKREREDDDDGGDGGGEDGIVKSVGGTEENERCSDDEEGNEEHKFTRFFITEILTSYLFS